MSHKLLLSLILLTPLLGALGIWLLRDRPNPREAVSLLTALVLLGLVMALLPGVAAGERASLELFELLPGISIAFSAEPLGAGFAVVVALLWFVTVLYAIGYMRAHHEQNQGRFYLFFALAIAATIGAAQADNLLTLYLFYEALTLATYPLVTHGGEDKDRKGGRTYLGLLLGTSLVFLLLAMGWTYGVAGTLTFTPGGILAQPDGSLITGLTPALLALLFALFVFGTGKAALMPFHRWLPAAMVAPTPVSALLHAVAVVKLGVFAVLKVTVYIFGIETLNRYNAALLIQYVAAATLLLAAFRALGENNLKRRLAYSTISQLAYIVLAATLANSMSLAAGGLLIAAHAMAKITLFFCAGMILVSLHKTTVTELDGIGRQMPVTLAAWFVASLCIIGLPLTGGFWSKWYLAQGALEAGQPLMLAVILLGSLLAMGYLIPPVIRAFFAAPLKQPDPSSPAEPHSLATPVTTAEAPRPALLALIFTATLSVLLFFAVQPMLGFLSGFTS
ncbi:MAG TPA: proton-conducting transporter membrane subunit [Xanthomonadales bacterium]|nr:proton-conducting transporter membrane subunit [Xanthomonadales bacterium]